VRERGFTVNLRHKLRLGTRKFSEKIASLSSKKQNLLYISLIVLIGVIIYANSFDNEFVWDDEDNIYNNKYIQDWKYLPRYFTEDVTAGAGKVSNYYRPLPLLMFSINYHIWGLNTFGYHLTNFLFHILSAVLLYYFVLLLLNKKLVAFLTGLLFTIHPVQPEAVTYMAGTADPMSMMFLLLSIVLFILSLKLKRIYIKITFYLISILSFVITILSKESMALLPILLMLIDYCFFEKKLNFRAIRNMVLRALPFFVVSGLYAILRLTVLNFGNTLNFYTRQNIYSSNLGIRLLTFFKIVPEYFRILIWPTDLHMERSIPIVTSVFDPSFFVFLIFSVVVLYFIISTWKKTKLVFFGFAWFFLWMLPYSNIFPINAVYMDHWLYVPCIGVFLIAAYFYDKFRLEKRYLTYILIFYIIFFSLGTIQRNNDWQNAGTLYTNMLQYSSETARVHNNLAMYYGDKGLKDETIYHYKLAIAISDVYPQTHYNLGNVYLKLKRIDDAIQEYKKAIEIDDSFILAHKQLASIYYAKKMYAEYNAEIEKIKKLGG